MIILYAMGMDQSETGFRFEADMLPPLIEHTSSLVQSLPGEFHTFFEVQAAAGIPDLVIASFNDQELDFRYQRGLGPILDLPDVATMTILGASYATGTNTPWSSAQLAMATGVTRGYLSSTILRRLECLGHVRRIARGKWTATHAFNPIANHVISIEMKRNDWRAGFWQANRQASDFTWLVIDAARSTRSIAKESKFFASKVGLATLSMMSELRIIVPAVNRHPSAMYRNLLAERVVALHLSGEASGPIHPVFGRDLRTTTGSDPRIVGAGAR
jgi:hypothetical protein